MRRFIIVSSMDDTTQHAKLLEVTENGTKVLADFHSHDWYNDGATKLAKERLVEFRGLVAFDLVKI